MPTPGKRKRQRRKPSSMAQRGMQAARRRTEPANSARASSGKTRTRVSFIKQAARFGLVGVANTVLSLALIYAFLFLLGWPDALANITGYAIGLLQSFVLNRTWTFRSQERILPSLARFLVVFAVAYSLNLALVLALRRAGVDQAIAHAAGMPVYTLVFFLLSRWFVFNRPPRPVTDLVDATPQ